jgi:hypothetical protein
MKYIVLTRIESLRQECIMEIKNQSHIWSMCPPLSKPPKMGLSCLSFITTYPYGSPSSSFNQSQGSREILVSLKTILTLALESKMIDGDCSFLWSLTLYLPAMYSCVPKVKQGFGDKVLFKRNNRMFVVNFRNLKWLRWRGVVSFYSLVCVILN